MTKSRRITENNPFLYHLDKFSPFSRAPKHTHSVHSIHPPDEPIAERETQREAALSACTRAAGQKQKLGMHD